MNQTPESSLTVETLIVGPFQENTYFVGVADRKQIVIIDPGEEPEKLIGAIQKHAYEPVAIVNTHAHLDHMGAVQPLKEQYGIPFFLHPADREILESAPEHARLFGVRVPEVPEIDHELSDQQSLTLGGITFEVMHTPGHTPGGVTLKTTGRVFVGDTLFYGSIGRTDLPGGDLPVLLRSIDSRLLTLADETIVHAGHGPDTTIGRERVYNPFLTGEVPMGF